MNQCFNFVKAEGETCKPSKKTQLFKNFKPIQNGYMKLDMGIYFLNIKTGMGWLTFVVECLPHKQKELNLHPKHSCENYAQETLQSRL